VSIFGLHAVDLNHLADELAFDQALESEAGDGLAVETGVGIDVGHFVLIFDIGAHAAAFFAAAGHECQGSQEEEEYVFFHDKLLLVNDGCVGLKRIVGADNGVDMGGVEGIVVRDVVQLAAVAFLDGDYAGILGADDRAAAVLLLDAGGAEHESGGT